MINFKKITWKNFLSTGNSANTVLLNKSTTTLIIGKNGEGKSTILDALTFSLFGKPFRNINKPQLINSINQKNCSVEVEFSIGTKEYKIIRGIKPNIFEIWCDNELMNQDAAAKDYQKVLEQQILKLNYKTFTQVVVLGSASFVPFMQLPSHQRREVIEDILDIKIFSTMNQLLKEKIQGTKDEIVRTDQSISLAKQRVEAQKQIIETLSQAKAESLNSLAAKIEANENTIRETSVLVQSLSTEIATLTKQVEPRDTVDTDIEKANTLKTRLSTKIEHCEHHTEFFNDNDICPSCSQHISDEYKEKAILDLKKKIEENTAKSAELDVCLSKLNAQLTQLQNIQKIITDKNISLSTYNTQITMLNQLNAEMTTEMRNAVGDTSNVDDEKAKMKTLAKEALEQISQKTALQERRALEEVASALLKDTGIKTAIIREYLPAMNQLINKFLVAMDTFIHFELDESFNEVIKSRHRDDFTYASFSEGEKMRIDLAILFTWRQIAKMKNSVNTNLLILDEIFDSSLDVAGTDYFLQLMNTMGENTNVFVISHKGDVLFDKFRSVIKFEKRNDFSVIAGA
jgi:DNA repair exonuclease SbcCD ATPase subunit